MKLFLNRLLWHFDDDEESSMPPQGRCPLTTTGGLDSHPHPQPHLHLFTVGRMCRCQSLEQFSALGKVHMEI